MGITAVRIGAQYVGLCELSAPYEHAMRLRASYTLAVRVCAQAPLAAANPAVGVCEQAVRAGTSGT